MPLSLNQMYRVTPPNIRANSRIAQVAVRRRGGPKKYAKLGDTYEIIYKVKATTDWRNVTLRFLKKKPKDQLPLPGLNQPVWVRCTCPWFLYNCEYALAKNGSSWIHYSNGAPADKTNPGNIPFVCKHVYALRTVIDALAKDVPGAQFREPKNKVLPKDTLKNLLNKPEKVLDPDTPNSEPVTPKLTPQQERMKDQTIEQLEDLQDQSQQSEAPKSMVNKIKDTLNDVIERVNDSDEPIANTVKNELGRLVNEVKDKGQKALTDNRIVRKLNDLIKRFRGF